MKELISSEEFCTLVWTNNF